MAKNTESLFDKLSNWQIRAYLWLFLFGILIGADFKGFWAVVAPVALAFSFLPEINRFYEYNEGRRHPKEDKKADDRKYMK